MQPEAAAKRRADEVLIAPARRRRAAAAAGSLRMELCAQFRSAPSAGADRATRALAQKADGACPLAWYSAAPVSAAHTGWPLLDTGTSRHRGASFPAHSPPPRVRQQCTAVATPRLTRSGHLTSRHVFPVRSSHIVTRASQDSRRPTCRQHRRTPPRRCAAHHCRRRPRRPHRRRRRRRRSVLILTNSVTGRLWPGSRPRRRAVGRRRARRDSTCRRGRRYLGRAP